MNTPRCPIFDPIGRQCAWDQGHEGDHIYEGPALMVPDEPPPPPRDPLVELSTTLKSGGPGCSAYHTYCEGPCTDFDAVGDFHRKFGLPIAGETALQPHLISRDVAAFRWRFLMEELTELLEAMNHDDMPGIADALVDLVYVALGTAHYYGLPWERLFAEVQRANMTKVRAAPDASNSKRSSALDVVKPPGWQPPNIAFVLKLQGWSPK